MADTRAGTRRRFRPLVALSVVLAIACVLAAPFASVAAAVLGVGAVVLAVVAWGRARPSDPRALRLGASAFVVALLVGMVVVGSQGAGTSPLGGDPSDDVATVGTADGVPTSGTAIVDDVSASVHAYRPTTSTRPGGVPVQVTNIGDVTHSVTVELVAHDATGAEVARTTVAVDDLAPGATHTALAFADADAAVRAALPDATVEVVAITGA
ncbi:FxLYD domain-containing protein [Luteimicrobium subarcticum]|uniref:Uncharacterized protein n=1 Tax=Luteimicrobium subarcticum TaxID=620910 RepID=A0A2M8WQM4_9MICO|nr:FxLYD domain-containing protein [Luteimicrobium subarcticum]PJI93239.1 hypothetical protein CLV34_1804 [Luteimicrobium subarcticum]